MSLRVVGTFAAWTAALAVVAGLGYATRARWLPLVQRQPAAPEEAAHAHEEEGRVKITDQARKNLKLVVKPVTLTKTFWRTMQVPGVIVDRPGQTDRGVTSPVIGVVTKIHAFPGDTVRVGDTLVTIRLVSEFVQNAQAELYKIAQEKKLNDQQLKRLDDAAGSGAIPEARLVELRNASAKLETQVRAHRQSLLSRGLTPAQVDAVSLGKFVHEIDVVAPPPVGEPPPVVPVTLVSTASNGAAYEVQELKAHLGEQVQAGQVLGMLANHHLLYIEGRGFRSEATLLAKAAENGWPVEAEFSEDDRAAWPELKQTLAIRHMANEMDASSRTFAFFVPLVNQARTYVKEGRTFLVWRFRPGQRVRLNLRVEPLEDVIVLPAAAVVREGPEAYVFRANGDVFDRKPVQVLYEDRRDVVVANDGSLPPRLYVAQNAAAALNRVLKAQAAGGEGDGHHHHHHH